MDGDLIAQPSAPLGTAFHAPQTRLVTETGAPIEIDGQPITPDMISASVTLDHNGTGITQIVLNNQRHATDHKPVVPPWRYNKMDTLSFGKRIRVDMRYGAEGWTPMILARITDVTFQFPSATGAQITLKGEDLTSLIKTKPEMDEMFLEMHEIEIVKTALESSGSNLALPASRPPPAFTAPLPAITHEQAKSYLQFFQAFAERMDYEIFAEFDNIDPGQSGANVTAPDARTVSLHFEPARSATLDKIVTLHWGRDIVDFKPTFKAWEILTGARISGNVPRQRGGFEVDLTMNDAINDLHPAPDGPAPISAFDARQNAFADENRPEANVESMEASNIDEERAQLQATSKLRTSARQFLTADITTIGFTRLRPGIHVNLTGLYAPFDGIYYVTKTAHSIKADGYTTKTSLRRPGMLDPADYPDGGSA